MDVLAEEKEGETDRQYTIPGNDNNEEGAGCDGDRPFRTKTRHLL